MFDDEKVYCSDTDCKQYDDGTCCFSCYYRDECEDVCVQYLKYGWCSGFICPSQSYISGE